MSTVKLGTVCMSCNPRNKKENLDNIIEYIKKAHEQKVDLLVFPEAVLTGPGTVGMQQFLPEDRAYLLKEAELIPEGDSTQELIKLAKKFDMYICWGMTERDPEKFDIIYNASVLIGPEGFIGKYRKVHLPLCEALIHYPGKDEFPVFDTKIGKIGLQICYDKFFPEPARCLALKGAQIVANPTVNPNLSGKLDDPDHIAYTTFAHARCMENGLFFVDANMCGENLGGHSQIVGPNPGKPLATTGFDEGMAVAEVDIEEEIIRARTFTFGGSDMLKDRKPGMYKRLAMDNKYNPVYGGKVEDSNN